MSMNTQEAMEYLKKVHEETASQTEESVPTKDAVANTGDLPANDKSPNEGDEAPVPESDAEVGSEPTNADVSETKAEDMPQPKKKKPSKQEQVNYAFQREKARHKEQIAARDKRIAELEERIKKLAPLEQADFDPNDLRPYIDHKFALQAEQNELSVLKNERDQMEAEFRSKEAGERHIQQVSDCFDSEEDREHYWALLRNGGKKFRTWLAENDPDNSIDKFIGESPIAPLIVSALMRNPEIRESIVTQGSERRKERALEQLENRLQLQRRLRPSTSVQTVRPGTQPTQKPRHALPILGSQVANPGSASESTKRDWNRYLEENPR